MGATKSADRAKHALCEVRPSWLQLWRPLTGRYMPPAQILRLAAVPLAQNDTEDAAHPDAGCRIPRPPGMRMMPGGEPPARNLLGWLGTEARPAVAVAARGFIPWEVGPREAGGRAKVESLSTHPSCLQFAIRNKEKGDGNWGFVGLMWTRFLICGNIRGQPGCY